MTSITRQDYMNNPCHKVGAKPEERMAAHRAYFAQFVTEGRKHQVVERFGLDRLVAAGPDSSFNQGFDLTHWDFYDPNLNQEFKEHGDFWSLANSCCVFKEAARQVVEAELKRQKGNNEETD